MTKPISPEPPSSFSRLAALGTHPLLLDSAPRTINNTTDRSCSFQVSADLVDHRTEASTSPQRPPGVWAAKARGRREKEERKKTLKRKQQGFQTGICQTPSRPAPPHLASPCEPPHRGLRAIRKPRCRYTSRQHLAARPHRAQTLWHRRRPSKPDRTRGPFLLRDLTPRRILDSFPTPTCCLIDDGILSIPASLLGWPSRLVIGRRARVSVAFTLVTV
ncbi:hypothetical protein LZ30DRAFT_449177 [Colletotrichum cereale]|nr:hypothetical protein LZ30DRAFT_449177 [Colletotrichum cereale]